MAPYNLMRSCCIALESDGIRSVTAGSSAGWICCGAIIFWSVTRVSDARPHHPITCSS